MLLKNKLAIKSLAVLCVSLFIQTTQADVVNGDFSGGETGWGSFIYGDPFITPSATSDPSVSFASGEAILKTGEGYGNEATICQGASVCDVLGSPVVSPFLVESDALTLEFDVAFLTLGADSSETSLSSFTDAINVQLWNPTDFLLDISIYVDSSGKVSLDLANFAGTGAALFLRLIDEDDGYDTQVTIDNVAVVRSAPVAVPESSTLYLLLSGLLMLVVVKRRTHA